MALKTSEWRPGPTVCRCCLSEGCYKDIATEYFWMGKREVYAEMLLDTLNLTIPYAQTGGPSSHSRLICEPCISRLRDATDFKRQVKECEQAFQQCLNPSLSTNVDVLVSTEEPEKESVKVEIVKQEDEPYEDDDFADNTEFLDDDDDLDDQPLMTLATKVPKKENVDETDLLDNAKPVKRKSTAKTKASPAKKAKAETKPTTSKPKPEKKKKGREKNENASNEVDSAEKPKYKRSARSEARFITKQNATALLDCWTFVPFRWKVNRFKCAYCESGFTDCTDLREHVVVCAGFHKIQDIYGKFREMSLINVDVTNAVCKICACPFTNMLQSRKHVLEHNFEFDETYPDGVLPISLNKNSWGCVLCDDKFNNFLKLYEHMNVHYQNYVCPTCGKGFMTAQRLRKHSEVHVKGLFPCDKCGQNFTGRAGRDYHKANVHAKGPRYECPHCDMRFSGYYLRMEHMKEVHKVQEVTYKCVYCDKTFKRSGKRSQHVMSEHFPEKRKFTCTFCDMKFKTNYELKRHIVKHTGEKNYSCNVCGKGFLRYGALRIHLKNHGFKVVLRLDTDSADF